MRKAFILFTVLAMAVTSPSVGAQDVSSYVLTDEQIDQVRSRCVTVQSLLSRLRANDGLRRVNLGQQYETISSRLMAPLNSRIALNKFDGVELVKTTVDFNEQLDVFRERYRNYEQDITAVIDMKCKDQPVSFYDGVMKARIERQLVRDAVDRQNALLAQFNTQFEEFAKEALAAKGSEQ